MTEAEAQQLVDHVCKYMMIAKKNRPTFEFKSVNYSGLKNDETKVLARTKKPGVGNWYAKRIVIDLSDTQSTTIRVLHEVAHLLKPPIKSNGTMQVHYKSFFVQMAKLYRVFGVPYKAALDYTVDLWPKAEDPLDVVYDETNPRLWFVKDRPMESLGIRPES